MYRTHHCGALNIQFVGQEVTLAGWVQTIRKFGAITFVDLRDRYGITCLLYTSPSPRDAHESRMPSSA